MDFSMECLEFVYGTLDGCLCFWWCFGFELVDCNPQVRNICIKEILGF